MNLANHISNLLYRYDCVIVPNFGGFVTNTSSATLNRTTHILTPPSKKVSFNSHLKHNDGLLANFIASSEKITFEEANENIVQAVKKWMADLELGPVEIAAIGTLEYNTNHQLVFEPNTTTNFLTTSFGLSEVSSVDVQRAEKVIALNQAEQEKTTRIPTFIKYAATAAILLTIGSYSVYQYTTVQDQKEFAKQQRKVDQKIQEATFVIDNPLPTIDVKVTSKKGYKFHVIAGAFQFEENAKKKVNILQRQGYKAFILGKNKWGLTQVAFESYATRNEARKALITIQNTISSDAWLLISE